MTRLSQLAGHPHARCNDRCSVRVVSAGPLKALVAKLQRMQFGKSSEKLRAKTERQIQEAQERISALQEEMAETLGEQYDPALPSALRQSSARKPLPASLPRETRVIRPEEECCPACGGELSSLGCDVSEQLELISSAFKVIETQRPKLACCRGYHIVQAPVPSKPIARSYAGAGLLAHVVTGKYADHLPLYRQSEIYRRQGVKLSRATLGRWTGAVAELLEPLYDVLRQYVLMPPAVSLRLRLSWYCDKYSQWFPLPPGDAIAVSDKTGARR